MEVLWLLLGLNFVLVTCALWAAITARSCLKATRLLCAASSTRSLAQLDAEVAALAVALSSTTTTTRRLSSRIGMRDLRERRSLSNSTTKSREPTDPAEKKAWLRRGLASGQLRVIRDGVPTTQQSADDDAADYH